MPWTGELYAESHDGRIQYRLYFIERRPGWHQVTDEIIGSGIGGKPVDETADWNSGVQTREIHDAMVSGVARCENTRKRWRRWKSK
ncbi:hypothetical protein [Nocardia sp. BMG51109]|uniref:hypothetical protein n=1 Tax=Nocardia sp. BMG51109 TaxID=1056816 RepID=UPI0004B67A55|nr:hypothetical protein [Nocardia sp. BMG51109]